RRPPLLPRRFGPSSVAGRLQRVNSTRNTVADQAAAPAPKPVRDAPFHLIEDLAQRRARQKGASLGPPQRRFLRPL
ncbi:MAG: hypothetical protein AAFR10_21885, partial [Pseudomonadota bacterium]